MPSLLECENSLSHSQGARHTPAGNLPQFLGLGLTRKAGWGCCGKRELMARLPRL